MMSDDFRHRGEPYAYCERVTGQTWHIRKLDDRGLKPGGIRGKPALSLCRMGMVCDFDVQVEPLMGGICISCAEKYKEADRDES